MKYLKAYRFKLYPNKQQANAFARHAGACRWLWNHLLALQKQQYAETKTFIFFHDMSKMLPGLKEKYEWLSEAPSNSLVRVCRNLDLALKKCFKEGAGFPRFKVRGRCRESFYVINQALRIDQDRNKVFLPKTGEVKFRSGRLPEGVVAGANVAWTGRGWELTIQCKIEADVPVVIPEAQTVVGGDFGLKELLVRSDGVKVKPPKSLRKALKRLARAQKSLARRTKGGKNRTRQARLVGRLHAKVRDTRRDVQHKTTSALVRDASAVITENLNIKAMVKNRHLALSISDAGWGEMNRQITYKCEWAGKQHIKAGQFEPTTQTCSACYLRKTGDDKLRLHNRTFRCDCGLVIDRDLNAAMNLRRLGLQALGLQHANQDVGQAMPERALRRRRRKADACGEASGGRAASATLSHASRRQEPARSSTELSG
ncbi:transposase [Rhizobium sp. MHM7A]|uniref:RNA-guided endonuclease InsQ/TnpB family protein n=1 Tax=Rhizobium sp. MHM7A TaxID=2583233 RepID=UPI001FED8791|nr:transposase [Rhizobium sp. MHM7A]